MSGQRTLEEGDVFATMSNSSDNCDPTLIRDELNVLYELRHQTLQQEFHQYHIRKSNDTIEFLIFLTTVFVIAIVPISLINFSNDMQESSSSPRYPLRIIVTVVASLASIASALIGFLTILLGFERSKEMLLQQRFFYCPTLQYVITDVGKPLLHGIYILLVQLYFIATFARRSFGLTCTAQHTKLAALFGAGKC